MLLTYGTMQCDVLQPCTAAEGLRALKVNMDGVLAAQRGGQVLELGDVIPGGGELAPITLKEEEGRRVYERSLRFVMLLAVRRLHPGQRVRIEYSVGRGVLVQLPGMTLTAAQVAALETEMRRITADNLPFIRKVWKLEDAKRYFADEGQTDKEALLQLRPFQYFTMYGCGGMWEYFYGAMAPSTGYVPVFALIPHAGGFVMQLPAPSAPDYPAPYVDSPKHLAVFAQSAAWCSILQVENAADLARLMHKGGMRTFIRVNEALHDKAIAAIAESIVQRGRRVVLIAGPSSSGKTTFAGRLDVQLRVLGYHPVKISLDNYYRNRDTLPRQEDGSLDLEDIHALDLPLLQQQVRQLLAGETVEVPRFSFVTGKREEEGVSVALAPGEMVLLEGIHGLNPLLSEGIPEEYIHRVFVSALTCLNLDDHNRIRTTDVRLLRRIVRDHQFRGTSAEATLRMWQSVRQGEDRWIFPFQEQADSMFNTALHYELPILKCYAYDLISEIPDTSECYLLARRLLKTLHYIPAPPEELLDEIPPISLLREFIGGSTFDED